MTFTIFYRSKERRDKEAGILLCIGYWWWRWAFTKKKKFCTLSSRINGAVNGFSRMVIWLHAYTTNSNPRVIAANFLDEVEKRSCIPTRIRSDLGTENRSVEQMQILLRGYHDDQFSERCYITGSSNHNQRIEQWWGFLRKHHAQYWMNIFQDLKEQDHFSGDLLDKNRIQFTCLEIIEVAYFCYSLIISFMDILFY